MQAKSICLIQLRQLGDILLTSPCFRAIKKDNPNHKLTVVTHKMGTLVLKNNPYIDHHLTYHESQSIKSTLDLISTLKKNRYDYVLDLMNNPRSAFLSLMSQATVRASYPSSRRFCYNRILKHQPDNTYLPLIKLAYLEQLGFQADGSRLDLACVEEGKTAKIEKFLAPFKQDLKIVLSPTHRRKNRQWPLENYAKLAEHLTNHYKAKVFIVWGPGEKEDALNIQKSTASPVYIPGPTNFSELAALIAGADFFIGNSNGPSHLAVAVDTPSLQLHGHTNPEIWCPNTPRHRALQGSHSDISTITVQSVQAALHEMRNHLTHKAMMTN